MKDFDISNFKKLSLVSSELLRLQDNRIFAIEGDLGSGKTTLVKYICFQLNVVDSVSSPTFPIVNEYICSNKMKYYHFDLYRIDNIDELFSLGFEDYISSGSYCFIEWPNIALPYLNNFCHLKLTNSIQGRKLSIINKIL